MRDLEPWECGPDAMHWSPPGRRRLVVVDVGALLSERLAAMAGHLEQVRVALVQLDGTLTAARNGLSCFATALAAG